LCASAFQQNSPSSQPASTEIQEVLPARLPGKVDLRFSGGGNGYYLLRGIEERGEGPKKTRRPLERKRKVKTQLDSSLEPGAL